MLQLHNKDIEQNIIANLIVDCNLFTTCDYDIEDFYNLDHQFLFKSTRYLYRKVGKVDMLSLLDYYKELGTTKYDMGYLVEITENVDFISYQEHISILKDYTKRRKIKEYGDKFIHKASDLGNNLSKELSDFASIGDILLPTKNNQGDIGSAINDFGELRDIYNSKGRLGDESEYKNLDKFTQGIVAGRSYMILAYSNVGKSRFAYSYIPEMLRQGKKVLFFSLEVDKGMLMTDIITTYYQKTNAEVFNEDFYFDPEDFKNLEIIDNVYGMDEIETITKVKKPDIIFIDFIQNIQIKGMSEYERMTDVGLRIQKLAKSEKSTVFSISQANNESRFSGGEKLVPKGSGQLFASSDLILGLTREDTMLKLTIVKNKLGPANIEFLINPDFTRNNFKLTTNTQIGY